MNKITNLIQYINWINEHALFDEEKVKDKMQENNDISELQMHKILYFLYGGFLKHYNKEIFKPKFAAWQYGPVETKYRTKKNDKNFIDSYFKINLNDFSSEEKDYLEKTTKKLLKLSPWTLVELSHLTDAWIIHSHNMGYIEKDEIINSFQRVNI